MLLHLKGVYMLDTILYAWFALTALSAAYVAWDAFRNNPEMTVMKWGWVLVTLYTGPVGLVLYILACKEPAPGKHEDFVKPLWKQSLGSTIHCLAGDATGIIVAASITAVLGFPMWLDVISEYFFGFLFGLLIFQALLIRQCVEAVLHARVALDERGDGRNGPDDGDSDEPRHDSDGGQFDPLLGCDVAGNAGWWHPGVPRQRMAGCSGTQTWHG